MRLDDIFATQDPKVYLVTILNPNISHTISKALFRFLGYKYADISVTRLPPQRP